jgi:phytoene dehydrogenase-like protein
MPDAVIVGAGPNGLAAAIVLARAGRSVLVLEAADTVGGGTRTQELTLPGFRHDVCSAIHPLGVGSPFLRTLPLERHGLEWIRPPVPLAHPFDDGTAALLEHSPEATGATLGEDAEAYRRLLEPLVGVADALLDQLLGPLRVPRHPAALARFSPNALRSAASLARHRFRGERARGLFAGLAAHAILPLSKPPTGAVGLVFAILGHVFGWPFPRGGSQALADSLASYLRSLGGEIECGRSVQSLSELAGARTVLLDVTPRQLLALVGDSLPTGYRRRLGRYRYGPGVFKLDLALDGPVPWRASECARSATVHLGATLDEIAASEQAVAEGRHPERPYILLAQHSLFDTDRAPPGKHTVWAYCHVPNGSTFDMAERIEAQIERFAPGFRQRIIARHALGPVELERYSANYVGGDIAGGTQDLRQLFTRPVARVVPYSTPLEGVYLCSSSTPPGAGVHGMCGYFAARAALRAGAGVRARLRPWRSTP